jgi:methylaspartate mutase epsilon subunit
VLPLLVAEINYVYLTALARRVHGPRRAAELGAALVRAGTDGRSWPAIAAAFGLAGAQLPDLERLARPFRGQRFAGPPAYAEALRRFMLADLGEAEQGNVDGPLKAALDVIRDTRDAIRAAVEFGGLDPDSYEAFSAFAGVLSLLSTGPPAMRTEQFLALAAAGVVEVAGPETVFGFDTDRRQFVVESPWVAGSRRHVPVLVDSRIPRPHIGRNTDVLIRQLATDGVIDAFVNQDASSRLATGGIRITPAESRVVAASGHPHEGLYAIGVPVEDVRWFNQIGNGRPGSVTTFHRQADGVALSIVRRLLRRGRTSLSRQRSTDQ